MPRVSKKKASYIQVTSPEELERIIKAGTAVAKLQAVGDRKQTQEAVQWADEARVMNRQQQPTLQALAQADASLKSIEKKQVEGAEKQAAADAKIAKALEDLPTNVHNVMKAIPGAPPLPGAKPAEIAAAPGPQAVAPQFLTQAEFNDQYPGRSGSDFTHAADGMTYFGNKGTYIAITKVGGNKDKVYLRRPDGTEFETEVSPAMSKYIMSSKAQVKKFDITTLTPEDRDEFRKIRKFAQGLGPGDADPGAATDKKLDRVITGQGLADIEGPKVESATDNSLQYGTGVDAVEGPAVESATNLTPQYGTGEPHFATPKGEYFIDPVHWAKGKFTVHKRAEGGKLKQVISRKFDPSFSDLLSKRYDKRAKYSSDAIDLYKKFIQGTGLPVSKHSAKYKLVHGVQDEMDKLKLNMESMAAGNKSTDAYNECVELGDRLYRDDKLTKAQHDTLMHTLAKLLRE